MKRRTLFPVLCLLVLITGCGKSDAETSLDRYLRLFYSKDFDNAYTFLSAETQKNMPLEKYKTSYNNPIVMLLLERTTYEIQEVKINNDAATATVEITQPDTSGLMQFMGMIAMEVDPTGQLSEEERQRRIMEKLKGKHLPPVSNTETLSLVKEAEQWKVKLKTK